MFNLFNLMTNDPTFSTMLLFDIIHTNNGIFLEDDDLLIKEYLTSHGDDIIEDYCAYLLTDEYNMIYNLFNEHIKKEPTYLLKYTSLSIIPESKIRKLDTNNYDWASIRALFESQILYLYLSKFLDNSARDSLSLLELNTNLKQYLGCHVDSNYNTNPKLILDFIKNDVLRQKLELFIEANNVAKDLTISRGIIEVTNSWGIKKNITETIMDVKPSYDFVSDPYFLESEMLRSNLEQSFKRETIKEDKVEANIIFDKTYDYSSDQFFVERDEKRKQIFRQGYPRDYRKDLVEPKSHQNIYPWAKRDNRRMRPYPVMEDENGPGAHYDYSPNNDYDHVLSLYDWCWIFVDYKYKNKNTDVSQESKPSALTYETLVRSLIDGNLFEKRLDPNTTISTFRFVLLEYIIKRPGNDKDFINKDQLKDATATFCLIFDVILIPNVADQHLIGYAKIISLHLFTIIICNEKNYNYIDQTLKYFLSVGVHYLENIIQELSCHTVEKLHDLTCILCVKYYYGFDTTLCEELSAILRDNIKYMNRKPYFQEKNTTLFNIPRDYNKLNCFCKMDVLDLATYNKVYHYEPQYCNVHRPNPLRNIKPYSSQIIDRIKYYEIILKPDSKFVQFLGVKYNNDYRQGNYENIFEKLLEQNADLLDYFGFNTLGKFTRGMKLFQSINII